MEIRRVQITGGSSYVITLPKEWIKLSNIKKNDPLGLLRQSDGTLLITPKMVEKEDQKIKVFDISDRTRPDYLLRQLVDYHEFKRFVYRISLLLKAFL